MNTEEPMKKSNNKNLTDKKMSSGGKDSPRLDMKQYIKLAEKDPEALRFDLESEITNLLKEKFKQEGKPGESFLDYINRLEDLEIKRITLSKGGAARIKQRYINKFSKK